MRLIKSALFRWEWIAALAILCAVALQSEAIVSALGVNTASNRVLNNLRIAQTPTSCGENIEANVKAGQCVHYLELLTSLREVSKQDPGHAYTLLQQAEICQGKQRRDLLRLLEADLLAAQGRHSESCTLLSVINAKPFVLEQVERSYQNQDWESQAFYLDCLQKLEAKPGYVSPWLVSDQYARLGRHYELTGQLDKSLAAFTRSADIYPGVYANPITGQARVLRQQGKLAEAIEALIEGLRRPGGDNVNNFVILSDLAYLWELDGKFTQAYCAYEGAVRLLPTLDISMDPQHLRLGLDAGLGRLPKDSVPNYSDCGKFVSIPIPAGK